MVNAISILDQNCWPHWPQWECYGANVAGLISTGLWFIVLMPQVVKNWYRRSVAGLSFLWAVANFTASLVNLFFVFSVKVPLYAKVSAVYMPILELTILIQFFVYVPKPYTTKLLVVLTCLIAWGCLVELELSLPESRDKIQWVAITLWCVETFPQVTQRTWSLHAGGHKHSPPPPPPLVSILSCGVKEYCVMCISVWGGGYILPPFPP